MIIEGLITCASGSEPHVAALGPVVNEELTQWTLRPFQSSRVFSLLRANPVCVFHVIDDALPVVQLVLGHSSSLTFEQLASGGWLIREACHWFKLEIEDWNLDAPRSEARARLTAQGTLRPFWGWNRAKHGLLEAAILISRVHLMSVEELEAALDRIEPAIHKTAGPRELTAWGLVQSWRQQRRME